MYFVYDYVGLLLMMNMLTIVISHVTCIIPPIGSKALTPDGLKEKQAKGDAEDQETIKRWREFWLDREQNGRFSNWVLKEIAGKEEIKLHGAFLHLDIEALLQAKYEKLERL